MNFVFVSPNFPKIYSHFVKELHEQGVNVLGIGDEPFNQLNDFIETALMQQNRKSQNFFYGIKPISHYQNLTIRHPSNLHSNTFS